MAGLTQLGSRVVDFISHKPTCYFLAIELDVGDLSGGRAELEAVHGLVLDLARPQPRLQL